MKDNLTVPREPEKMRGINSILAGGDIECDKCGASIRHLERYCCNIQQCALCGDEFDSVTEIESHFSQKHPHEPPRGMRYCKECALKAGYLKIVRNKKLNKVLPAMLTLRDEEEMVE